MPEKNEQDECDLSGALAEAAYALEAKISSMKAKGRFPKELAPASEDYVRD